MPCKCDDPKGVPMMDATNTPAWVVTQQTETSDIGPDGTYLAGVKVTFRTARGVVGSVFVPHRDYSVDTVSRLVGERAAAMDAVAGLAG